ncbi:hypothetical protein [Cetobacterium somerae]|uniref:hypothetical protein n=1 Tax=Cetobacterium somerae TaxID=188913 RepID=UPI003892172D
MKFNELAKIIDELMQENFRAALVEGNDRRLSLIVENMLTRLKDIKIDDPYAPGAFDVSTAYNYGNSYKRSGKYLDAIALYMIASTKDCSGPESYNNIAAVLKLLGFQKSAYESYKVARLRFPGDYLLILRKSLLSFQLKNDDWYNDLKLLIKDDSTFEAYSKNLKNLYRGDEQINDVNQMFDQFKKRFNASQNPSTNQRKSKKIDENRLDRKGYDKAEFYKSEHNKNNSKMSTSSLDQDINLCWASVIIFIVLVLGSFIVA